MLNSVIVAYLHYLSFMLSFAALIVELFHLKKDISVGSAKIVGIADGVYGMAATTVLVTGVLRVMYFGKGAAYYMDNTLFWVKVGIFIAVGLLSLYPTITFITWWPKKLLNNEAPEIGDRQFKILSWSIKGEVAGFIFIPLFAALMARISI